MLPEILIQQTVNIRSLDDKRAGIQGYIIIITMFNTSKAPFYIYISSKALGDTHAGIRGYGCLSFTEILVP